MSRETLNAAVQQLVHDEIEAEIVSLDNVSFQRFLVLATNIESHHTRVSLVLFLLLAICLFVAFFLLRVLDKLERLNMIAGADSVMVVEAAEGRPVVRAAEKRLRGADCCVRDE